MNWDEIRKKLIGSPNIVENNDNEDGGDSIQIADEQSLPSKIYETVSPALDMVIPSAEAKNLSQFSPREYLENKRQQPTFNPKQYLQQTPQPKQQESHSKKQQTFIQPNKQEVKQFIIDEARKRGKDPALVLAHFEKESSLDPSAINLKGGGTGARGISQIRKLAFEDAQKFDKSGTLQNLKHTDMANPQNWKENIIAGLNYYDAINKYWKPKTSEEFLKSYNQGSPTAKGYKSQEAKEYAKDVMRRYSKYKKYVNELDTQKMPTSDDSIQLADQPINYFSGIKKLVRP